MFKIIEDIQELLDNKTLTSYKIGKDTGIPVQQIDRYRKTVKLENMTLKNALKLHEYYKKIKKTKEWLKNTGELTKEELLRKVEFNEYTIKDTRKGYNRTVVFKIHSQENHVELEMIRVYHRNYFGSEDSVKIVNVIIKGDNEEYLNPIYLSNDQDDVYWFLHELKLNYYGVIDSFKPTVKIDDIEYTSLIVPFEFREAQTLKLYKVVDREDLDKILKEGILPISKTGNNNWENNRRADNSTEVVYLFKPLTEQLNFSQYGDVLLEVETTAYKNEILPYDRNRGKYEEFITYEVKPEEIKKVTYLNE